MSVVGRGSWVVGRGESVLGGRGLRVNAGSIGPAAEPHGSVGGGTVSAGLALVDGEVAIGDGEGEDGHGGGVGVTALLFVGIGGGPGAILLLALEEGGADGGVNIVPIFSAELVGGLGAVVDGVVVVFAGEGLAGGMGVGAGEGVAEEVIAAGEGFLGVVLAEEFEGEDAGAGAGGVGVAIEDVGEAAAVDGAAFAVGDAEFDGFARDGGANVGGAAEGHELPAGDGDVGIFGGGRVAPAADIAGGLGEGLGGEDEADGFGDDGFDALLALFIDHAVGFAEHDGGDAVVVHGLADVGG